MTEQDNNNRPPNSENPRRQPDRRPRSGNRRGGPPNSGENADQNRQSRWRDPRSFRSVREKEEQETGHQVTPETETPPRQPSAASQERRNHPDPRQRDRQPPNQPAGEEEKQRSGYRSQPKRPLLAHRRAQDENNADNRPRGSQHRPRPQLPDTPPNTPVDRAAEPGAQPRSNNRRAKRSGRGNLQPKRSVDPKSLRPTLTSRALKSLMRGPKRVFKPGKQEQDDEEYQTPAYNDAISEPGAPVYRSLAELMEADRKAKAAQQPEQKPANNRRRGRQPDRRRSERGRGPDARLAPENRLVQGQRPAPSNPIPTTRGIKARATRSNGEQNWWARRWIEAMETIVDAHRLQRGRTYARDGQVLSIEESPYGVEARVQGSRREPYKVTFQLTPLTDDQWEQVIDKLAEQARFTAQLLAGDMPQDIESAFESADVGLFPQSVGDLYTSCSCPDWANPCKHVAATHYILGDRFEDDPFLLFRMRGRTQEQILDALRRRRSVTELDIPDEPPLEEIVPPPAAPVAPLVSDPNEFWDAPQSLDTLPLTIKPPSVEMPVLKLLGQPAFLPGQPLQDILGPVYQSITYAALRAAYSEDTPAEHSADDDTPPQNGNGKTNLDPQL